jgi:hypothetical protein
MATTNVATGSNLAITQQSVALTAQITRAPGNLNALTGPAPKQSDAEAMLKMQTSAEMPFVRVTDLSTDPKGDKVTVDAFNVVTGKPIMGDRNAEGQGQKLSSSSFDCKIDLATFNVDAGGKMSRQRTRHDLRRIARAELQRYFPNLGHLAGARGTQNGVSWGGLPLATDADFAEIMINTVKAPTYNRHLVVDGTTLVQGGLQLQSIGTNDNWKLSNLDELSYYCEAMETKLPTPRMVGDEQAYDSPLKGILMMPPGSYNNLITDMTSGNNLRAFQAAVEQRQKWAPNSAVFRGECGIWRGILVKKMEHTIQFDSAGSFQYVTVANRLTETETTGTVATISGFHVERSILLGGQALARCEGASNSGVQAAIIENTYNAGRNFEYLGEFMGGECKFRFKFPNAAGDLEFTDNGVMVIDAAVADRTV